MTPWLFLVATAEAMDVDGSRMLDIDQVDLASSMVVCPDVVCPCAADVDTEVV